MAYAIFWVENVGAMPGPTGSDAMRSPDFGTYRLAVADLNGSAASRTVSGLILARVAIALRSCGSASGGSASVMANCRNPPSASFSGSAGSLNWYRTSANSGSRCPLLMTRSDRRGWLGA